MERFVFVLCGIWVWLTRRRRIHAYAEAAKTLDLAHTYLLRDFTSRASASDRGSLLPCQAEALNLLETHATVTCMTAARLSRFGPCCRFVAEELRRLNAAPPIAVTAADSPVLRPATIRIRYRVPRIQEFPAVARFLRAESSGRPWPAHAIEAAETQSPFKAA